MFWNWRYFLLWLFIWIFYYFNSVKFKIASKSACTRNAALKTVMYDGVQVAFLSWNSLKLVSWLRTPILLNSNYLLSILLLSLFFFLLKREVITEKINSSEKRHSSVHRFNILKKMELYFLRLHSINFLPWKGNIFIFFSLGQLPFGAKLIVKL